MFPQSHLDFFDCVGEKKYIPQYKVWHSNLRSYNSFSMAKKNFFMWAIKNFFIFFLTDPVLLQTTTTKPPLPPWFPDTQFRDTSPRPIFEETLENSTNTGLKNNGPSPDLGFVKQVTTFVFCFNFYQQKIILNTLFLIQSPKLNNFELS